jgi:hypothetical protein
MRQESYIYMNRNTSKTNERSSHSARIKRYLQKKYIGYVENNCVGHSRSQQVAYFAFSIQNQVFSVPVNYRCDENRRPGSGRCTPSPAEL